MRLVHLLFVATLLGACSAPDPGVINFQSRGSGGSGSEAEEEEEEEEEEDGTTTQTAGNGGSAGKGGSGGAGGSAGTGGTSGAKPTDGFSGAKAFVAGTPADKSRNHHGNQSNAGQNCLSCHNGGTAPSFAAGGTIVRGAAAAAGVEVRIVNVKGEEVGTAYTDQDGNFWIGQTSATFTNSSLVGIRDANGKKLMSGPIGAGGGACNTCHGASSPKITM